MVRGERPRSTAACARKASTAASSAEASATGALCGDEEIAAQRVEALRVVDLPSLAVLEVEGVGHLVEHRRRLRDVDLEIVLGDHAREIVQQPEAVVRGDVDDRIEVRLLVRDRDALRRA